MKELEGLSKHLRTRWFRLEDWMIVQQAAAISHGRPGWQLRGLPRDVEVLAVWYEHAYKAFYFLACSMEWDICRDQPPPEAMIEVVEAPQEEGQLVLWQHLGGHTRAYDKVLTVEGAVKKVTEWDEEGTKKTEAN